MSITKQLKDSPHRSCLSSQPLISRYVRQVWPAFVKEQLCRVASDQCQWVYEWCLRRDDQNLQQKQTMDEPLQHLWSSILSTLSFTDLSEKTWCLAIWCFCRLVESPLSRVDQSLAEHFCEVCYCKTFYLSHGISVWKVCQQALPSLKGLDQRSEPSHAERSRWGLVRQWAGLCRLLGHTEQVCWSQMCYLSDTLIFFSMSLGCCVAAHMLLMGTHDRQGSLGCHTIRFGIDVII